MRELFAPLITWYTGALESGGYPLIVLLMAMESSVIPLPSEVVIPPAAHLAHTRGTMTVPGVVVAGALGSWLGATVMYWLARWLGRPLILRYGRYLLVPPHQVAAAERWSQHYGTMGVFISRLLPVIRHLIGIPAGIVRLGFLRYSVVTVIGSAIWCAVLAWVGVKAGQDQQLMAGNLHRISLWLGGTLLVIGGLYYAFVHRQMKNQARGEQR